MNWLPKSGTTIRRRGRRDLTRPGVEVADDQISALPKRTEHHDRLVVEPLDDQATPLLAV
jgi:hypothetical protein